MVAQISILWTTIWPFVGKHKLILIGLTVFFSILGFYLSLLPSNPAPADGASYTLAAARTDAEDNRIYSKAFLSQVPPQSTVLTE